ncbi:MAG: cytochrome c oxidase accessory protein CcoG [Rhizobiales bacterium]|nr:cytochrome c oxidase accessory protein CcoG [Hyphomicrobiales bacterium]NRB15293.1 cytochrome c oxidase accessory protein CcoG [Hyphomicrobiales bacterium]
MANLIDNTKSKSTDTAPHPIAPDAKAVNGPLNRELFEAKKKLYPKRVAGNFRNFKWVSMLLLLGFYYIGPWIRWDRGPTSPNQAILVDFEHGRFYFFFIEIWPQELYYIAGLLIMSAFALFLVTASVGRAWCGYACPQTVWVDLFIAVEHFIEGGRNARIRLDRAPWSVRKLFLRLVKHSIWLLIALLTGGAWIFYFMDAPTLFSQLIHFEAATVAYGTIIFFVLTTYTFGGHLREQVCTYMCPWPRIQAVMMDVDSLVVTYHEQRGEPRMSVKKRQKAIAAGEAYGDCVDCNMCVVVCPMGIDIRDGIQLECITCGLCIDACNDVSDKLKQPRGLISYDTINNENIRQQNPTATHAQGIRWPWHNYRNYVYLGLFLLVGFIMVYSLNTRDRFAINALHDRNPLYVQLADGSIRNSFEIKLLNMQGKSRQFVIYTQGLENSSLTTSNSKPGETRLIVSIDPDRVKAFRAFVNVPKANLPNSRQTDFKIIAEEINGDETAVYEAKFHTPQKVK